MINNSLQKQRKHSSSGGRLFQAGKLIALLMLLCTFVKVTKANELTVYDGTTESDYVPMFVFYFDDWTKTQFVIPSSELTSMVGGTITELKFYTTSYNIPYTTVSSFVFYMKEVDYTSISSYEPQANAQQVYSGYGSFVSVSGGGTITITFGTPYVYHGGNLLIGCENTTDTNWKNIYFYGQSVSGASISGSHGSNPSSVPATQRNFIPKTTFYYEPAPANIEAESEWVYLGEIPNNAWSKPVSFTLTNNGGKTGEITAIESDNDYFTFNAQLPIELAGGESIDIDVITGVGDGDISANISVTYLDPDEEQTYYFDLAALAYNPVEGDVWENPIDMGTVSIGFNQTYNIGTYYTGGDSPYHHIYDLPESQYYAPMKDVVFKFTVEEDFVLYVLEGGDSKLMAVYAEDFGGIGYPNDDNYLHYGYSDMNQYMMAGTYYLVIDDSDDVYRYTQIYINQVPAPYYSYIYDQNYNSWNGKTNVDNGDQMKIYVGEYSKEMQVLVGTQYPPTTVMLDWTSDITDGNFYDLTLEGLNHNTVYFAQVKTRNNTGTNASSIYPFTTVIDPVEGFAVEDADIFVGEDAVFTWDAVRPVFLGYNFYQDGVKLNEELLTTNTMTIEDLDYNMNGYVFGVTTVYESGESEAEEILVRVSGNGSIQGNVYEQDGETPINNISVRFQGQNEFGEDEEYVLTTNENGFYQDNIHVGHYHWTVYGDGYQTYDYPYDIYTYYNMPTGLWDVLLDEMFYPVAGVTAVEEGENVKVDWEPITREFQYYRVYRTLENNDGPYTTDNTVLVAETTDLSTLDEAWSETEEGVLYKYGVSCLYEGNRDNVTEAPKTLAEGFDDGLPEGWAVFGDYNWMLGSEAGLGYYKGHNGSKDMMISKSYEYGSGIYPNNYLVTPKVTFTSNSEFSFWACAQDANYPNEFFGVAVSTGSQTNEYDFWMVDSWQMSAKGQGNWYKYTVDLSGYAGMEGYIAIRHYNCYGQFYLDVDDVELRDLTLINERESEIVWSDPIGRNMFIENGVEMTVKLNNLNESPVGATISFVNTIEAEQANYPIADVTITEDMIVSEYDEINDITTYHAYYMYDSFRRGEYRLTITREDYETVITYRNVTEPDSLVYTLTEELLTPDVFTVSSTGWATWYNNPDTREFEGYYLYFEGDFYYPGDNNYVQLNVDNLTEGNTYYAYLYAQYTSETVYAYTTFSYSACDNFEGVSELEIASSAAGNIMSWEYPEPTLFNDVMSYDNGNNYGTYGYSSLTNFYWGVRFDAGTFASNMLSEVMVYDRKYMTTTMYICNNNGDPDIDNALYSTEVQFLGNFEYKEITFSTPIEIDQTKDLSIVIFCNTVTYAAVTAEGGDKTHSFYSSGGYYWYQPSRAFMIRTVFEETLEPEGAVVYRDGDIYDFTEEASYVDEGVMDDHNYQVRVVYTGNIMSCPQGVNAGDQIVNMTAGWNWWSTCIEQANYDGLGVLESGLGENGIIIKSRSNGFVSYDETSGEWSGSLDSITNESMYKVKTTEGAEFSMYGVYADPEDHPITIDAGWSWIGVPAAYPLNLNDALVGLAATEGDMIKSQQGFATYDAEGGWFGSLNVLEPGKGYMYKSLNTEEVTFVFGVDNRGDIRENVTSEHWMANYGAYPNNMTVMAVVNVDNIEVVGDYELAVFANGECRGSVKLIPVKNRYMAFLTVAGEETAELSFALYNANTETEIFGSNNVISFSNNATVGDIDNPYVVNFRGAGIDELSSNMAVYPNPVVKGGNVTITLAEQTETMQVEVINTLGEVVYVEKFGQSQANITMPEKSGVYMIRIVTDNNNTMFRKVVVE